MARVGTMQDWVLVELGVHSKPMSIAWLHKNLCEEKRIPKRLCRSARHSLTHAIRSLARTGKITQHPQHT
jgi:hypothetical protein